MLILQNGRPVYSRSMGVREAGGSAPIGENDLFRLASMTKAVTSVATMILVEEGKIGRRSGQPLPSGILEPAGARA